MTNADAHRAAMARRAAEEAEAATLWDVAAERYEECLSELAGSEMSDQEPGLLVALGRCYWNQSEARSAWRTLRRAIALYRERGDADGVARATIEILRIWGPPERQRAMADEALEQLGETHPELRAMLLLQSRRMDEALALADKHDLTDVKLARVERAAWAALEEGRVAEGNARFREVHEASVALNHYQAAAGVLRGSGFMTLAAGDLDEGERIAKDAVAYARRVHLRFTEQLALMDLVGSAFARCDFDGCESLIREMPGATDFRADLYRMWIAELRGDMPSALALLVDPERGGGATTALSQTHAAAAGLLFHAGRHAAAAAELERWIEISREGRSLFEEAPAMVDCIITLAGDGFLSELLAEYEKRGMHARYSTLQGRGQDYVHGALARRLGASHAARAAFERGLAWAERERCPIEAGRCLQGLGEVFLDAGERQAASEYLQRAREIFQRVGASLYLDQISKLGA